MPAEGFLEQRPRSPASFGAVLALHGAVIAAVLLVKGPEWAAPPPGPIQTYDVKVIEPPPVELPPQPKETRPAEQTISRYDLPTPVVPSIPRAPVSDLRDAPLTQTYDIGKAVDPPPADASPAVSVSDVVPPPERIVSPPVRTDAIFDPRFASAMQPPYPMDEERKEREGTVRLRVTIGADGRVTGAERLSATSDSFWAATERHARARWRFRPATLDGRPVSSSKVLSIRFQLGGR